MARLSKAFINENKLSEKLEGPVNGWAQLPEKVLQFGTGVLLRGLPDYFIDKANRQGVFNGRIVVIKSTDKGGTDEFSDQDSLYTLHVKGIEKGKETQKSKLISSISRVLSAAKHWEEILDIATKDELELIISNTTEVGINLDEEDDVKALPPASFPAKLTALLHKRFLHFNGDIDKGLVILPTELISDNGSKLKEIVVKLAHIHLLGYDFINWLNVANYFCNTLVDRIVPGKLPREEQEYEEQRLGYKDDLAILAEPFRLWAIESDSAKVKKVLSFSKADKGVFIVPDIQKFKELKLRLLNGSHTFSCGLALLCGFSTVKDTMKNDVFLRYMQLLMQKEIIPAMMGEEISEEEALDFAANVIDRFRNPFLNHQWTDISFNYTSKVQMRTIALIEGYVHKQQAVPQHMALGFAAYLLFMKGETGNSNNEKPSLFSELWKKNDTDELVNTVLKNQDLWKTDLSTIPGFAEAVNKYLQLLTNNDALSIVKQVNEETEQLIAQRK